MSSLDSDIFWCFDIFRRGRRLEHLEFLEFLEHAQAFGILNKIHGYHRLGLNKDLSGSLHHLRNLHGFSFWFACSHMFKYRKPSERIKSFLVSIEVKISSTVTTSDRKKTLKVFEVLPTLWVRTAGRTWNMMEHGQNRQKMAKGFKFRCSEALACGIMSPSWHHDIMTWWLCFKARLRAHLHGVWNLRPRSAKDSHELNRLAQDPQTKQDIQSTIRTIRTIRTMRKSSSLLTLLPVSFLFRQSEPAAKSHFEISSANSFWLLASNSLEPIREPKSDCSIRLYSN